MPYENLGQLPAGVAGSLPVHAQRIYRSAYNNAWFQYEDADEGQYDSCREDTARKVAWAAVRQQYEQREGRWQEKRSIVSA